MLLELQLLLDVMAMQSRGKEGRMQGGQRVPAAAAPRVSSANELCGSAAAVAVAATNASAAAAAAATPTPRRSLLGGR